MKRALLALFLLCGFSNLSSAQISFSSAVDLALRNNPRVKMAEAEVAKTQAILDESHNVYLPALIAGSGLGYTYGFPVGTPTLFNFTLQSLAYDQSQHNYIRAAQHGLKAAKLSLKDVRERVGADAATTYLAVDSDLLRLKALDEQQQQAQRLVTLVQQRMDAGQDTHMELTRAKLNAAQVHLRRVMVEDDLAIQQAHLMRITNLASTHLLTETASIPAMPDLSHPLSPSMELPYSVKASYESAQSKLQQAFGDQRKMYRPQIAFAAQYNRFASFNGYDTYYQHYQADNVSVGIQLTLPIFDFLKRSKSKESIADAAWAQHEADFSRDQFLDTQTKNVTLVTELQARAEVIALERDLAQDQLDEVRTQLRAGNPNGQPITPKDEQNAMVQERQKYLDYLDAELQLRQAQVELLRTSGQMEEWLKISVRAAQIQPSR